MSTAKLVIVSDNADFSGVLAEHAARELGIAVQIFATAETAKAVDAQLVIEQAQFENQKPLRLQDILARIEQQLKREEHAIGEAVFSVQQKTITQGGKTVSLTDKETQLLLALIKNKNGVEKDALLKNVWGVTSELESHTLETHVYRLRAKLKDAGVSENIVAAPGKYILEL